jgi:hypothetical protein
MDRVISAAIPRSMRHLDMLGSHDRDRRDGVVERRKRGLSTTLRAYGGQGMMLSFMRW